MPAVDAAALDKLMRDLGGEKEVIRDLVQTFLDEAPKLIAIMTDAVGNGVRKELNRAAHSMKSTSATFGALRLSELCRDLERDSEQAIPPAADARVGAVAAEWAAVQRELVAWAA